jgi:hypothetical protein
MLGAFLNERGLRMPSAVAEMYRSTEARSLEPYIYWPDRPASDTNSLDWALNLLREAATPPPDHYLPIMPVDDMSVACVPCARRDGGADTPVVMRWHLGAIDERYQDGLLDINVASYIRSVSDDMRTRKDRLDAIARIARGYYDQFVEKGVRPRGSVLRPVQLACQNVIIGMAAVRQDASFDGLQVRVFLTCEVPHLATHEANRALAALILCDAFQNGGTMEIRFGDVGKADTFPPALQQYGRTVGVPLGSDGVSLSPNEARSLFWAVTPMPDDLRLRCENLIDRGVVNPERLCFTLLSSIWQAIELDYICATSSRVERILRGGASPGARLQRTAELETCRAAVMVGMLQRHIDNADFAAHSLGGVRVFEDNAARVLWSVRGDVGAVALSGTKDGRLPWISGGDPRVVGEGGIVCVPRGLPTPMDYELVRALQEEERDAVVSLLVPVDMAETVPAGIPVMLCPDRLAAIDGDVERRLGQSRVGRL